VLKERERETQRRELLSTLSAREVRELL